MLAALWLACVAFGYAKGAAHERRADDERIAVAQAAQLKAQIKATTQRQAAAKEITDDLRKQTDAARAAAAGNRTAGERLRDQLARACLGPIPSAAGGSDPAAGAAGRVLADVQRRLAEAENRVVEFADASRRAGLGCEKLYDQVTNPKE
jgi:hypothetical protein